MNEFKKFSSYIYSTGRALDIVTTTSRPDGYPEKLGYALTGFDSWNEAEEAAKALNGEIIGMHRRDGDELWSRDGLMVEPYTREAESDEEEFWPAGERAANEYWEQERTVLAEALQSGEIDAESLPARTAMISRVYEEIVNADEGQIVVTKGGKFMEVIEEHPASYHDRDVTDYRIGVIFKAN